MSAFSGASATGTLALFQDSTAGALAAVMFRGSSRVTNTTLTHYMDAGTISSTTFKVRVGNESAGTITLNGHSSVRKLGGVAASSITITEIKA